MAKSDKVAAVAELVERFRAADAVLLTEYRGLTVGQLKQLRRGLGENATYAVAKNTLARLAAKEVGLDFLAEDLKGPTAIAFVSGEPVEAAKTLRDFAKDNPAPPLKAGARGGGLGTLGESLGDPAGVREHGREPVGGHARIAQERKVPVGVPDVLGQDAEVEQAHVGGRAARHHPVVPRPQGCKRRNGDSGCHERHVHPDDDARG